MADERNEDGFEFKGRFYPWRVSDMGKDLMLIDRFTGMPISEFFEVVDDDFERGRAPIVLTLVATSLRAAHPDWSVDRVERTVMGLNLTDVLFVAAEQPEPEADASPPPEVTPPPPDEQSRSPSNGSSPSSTPQDSSTSATSSGAPL